MVTSITGDTISINKQKNILSAFGFVCNGTAMNRENHKNQEFGLEVIVPSWRNDVKTSHDLISELVRLMGVTFGEMKHVNIKKTETKLNQLRYLLLSNIFYFWHGVELQRKPLWCITQANYPPSFTFTAADRSFVDRWAALIPLEPQHGNQSQFSRQTAPGGQV